MEKLGLFEETLKKAGLTDEYLTMLSENPIIL